MKNNFFLLFFTDGTITLPTWEVIGLLPPSVWITNKGVLQRWQGFFILLFTLKILQILEGKSERSMIRVPDPLTLTKYLCPLLVTWHVHSLARARTSRAILCSIPIYKQRPSNLAKASLLLSSPVAEQRPLTPHSIHRVPYKQPLQPQTYLLYPFYTRIRHYNYSITRLF